MLNYKSVVYSFVLEPAPRRARVATTPTLGAPETSVPLTDGPCADWRATLKAGFAAEGVLRFAGAYPASCGDRSWPRADPPRRANRPAIQAEPPSFEVVSPPLAEVVRDINKFSNNTMAQQLFYTLAAQAAPGVPATPEAARAQLRQWLQRQFGEAAVRDALIDNGSGLSRDSRLTARLLAQLLQQAWSSPVMPELVASLPVAGLDGTMRRARTANGRAHLKTGSLRDSAGVAGYLLSDSGRRYVVVALINHPNANAARPAIEALLHWAQRDAPADQ